MSKINLQMTDVLNDRLSKAVNVLIMDSQGNLSLFDQKGNEILSSNPGTKGQTVPSSNTYDVKIERVENSGSDGAKAAAATESTTEGGCICEYTYVVNGITHTIYYPC